MSGAILQVRNLTKSFPIKAGLIEQLFQRGTVTLPRG
jgi:hypothetical protein